MPEVWVQIISLVSHNDVIEILNNVADCCGLSTTVKVVNLILTKILNLGKNFLHIFSSKPLTNQNVQK